MDCQKSLVQRAHLLITNTVHSTSCSDNLIILKYKFDTQHLGLVWFSQSATFLNKEANRGKESTFGTTSCPGGRCPETTSPVPALPLGPRNSCRPFNTHKRKISPEDETAVGRKLEGVARHCATQPLLYLGTTSRASTRKGPASASFPTTVPQFSLILHQNHIPQPLRASDSPVLRCEAAAWRE